MGLSSWVVTGLCGALVSCSGVQDGPNDEAVVESATQALTGAEEEGVARAMAHIRSLETPGNVYMASIEQTSASSGSFAHVVHVYQPDGTGEGIRFEVAAKTSAGVVDTAHTFQSVSLVSRPGQPDQTQVTLANGSGQKVWALTTSRSGWYRLAFTHGAPSGGRTLSIKAYDAAGNSLKMAWSDPPSVNTQVRARVAVTQASNVYFKGGAYRNTEASQFAYADNVRLNGTLLYRRSFDQGRFNFPIGRLNAGEHTLEFSLSSSSGPAKYWFGVDARSFDTLGTKTAWDPVQFLYQGSMRTGDYDAWSDGVAFRQSYLVSGSRPPPVRRGTTFGVTVTHSSLSSSNATLRVTRALAPTTNLPWSRTLPTDQDYSGALFVSGAPSTQNRENWRVTVPSDAPIGRYNLTVTTASGAQIGNPVVFYVIHDPYPLVASGVVSKAELEAFGYDEDEDGVAMQGPSGTDHDNARDHFSAHYEVRSEGGYNVTAMINGSFRRTRGEELPSVLDYAVAAADGTTNEFESMLRLYRVASQRIRYQHPPTNHDASDLLTQGGVNDFTPDMAFWFAQQGVDLNMVVSGQCYQYGHLLTAFARSVGMLARPASSMGWLGGYGNHVFTEAYIPGALRHGGKRTSSSGSANSDTDPWYAFDATDPRGLEGLSGIPHSFTRHTEAVSPRAQYGRATVVLSGAPNTRHEVVISPVSWTPLSTATVYNPVDVTSAYYAGPEFWLTGSGIQGSLGYGEKDVYRISKSVTGARAVRVLKLSGSASLDLKLCVVPVSGPPLSTRCSNAATSYQLPAGESYVVVFNDADHPPPTPPEYGASPYRYLLGDVARYVLDLEF